MTITISTASGCQLYHRYQRQSSPQDCYVELDCERRTLSASPNAEIGNAVPFAVWHHRVLRWSIPVLTDAAANALLDEIAPLAERVCDGYERVWDGNNHVGRYDADAAQAREQIERLCSDDWDEDQQVSVWDASDWFGGLGNREAQAATLGITATTTDAELDAIAERELAEAAAEDVDVLEGLDRHLAWLRDGSSESS